MDKARIDRFEDLKIYQNARQLSVEIYRITSVEPFYRDTRFVQQIRAASGSIMDNIAEGYERNGNKEFVNFLYIAKGSCGEVRSQLLRAHDIGFIDDATFSRLTSDCLKISVGIANMIKAIKASSITGPKYKS